jgi:hypothetical protein
MTYIPEGLRRAVIERARQCCEYCRLADADSPVSHEIDHIVPTSHRGQTTSENLAYSCYDCNRFKSSNIGSFDPDSGALERLFDPRAMSWDEHFELNGAEIFPRTAIGRVTDFVLQFNHADRILYRRLLLLTESYPCR